MFRTRSIIAWTISGALLAWVLPILGALVGAWMFPDFRFVHIPLHALTETAGALIALAVAGILIAEMKQDADTRHYPWMAAGLSGMGIFDLFHAVMPPGQAFVWFRVVATCCGGLFCGLSWVGPRIPPRPRIVFLPLAVGLCAVVASGCWLLVPDAVPIMLRLDGHFSETAIAMNAAGGLGFVLGTTFLARRFWVRRRLEDWLFAVQTALLAASAGVFSLSVIWDGGWWWWHLMRVVAYSTALGYALRAFRMVERELLRVNQQLSQINVMLDKKVEARTTELVAVTERFELAVRGSTDGLWDWNILTNEVFYSSRMKELLGYAPEEFPEVFASFEAALHPDDHGWVLQAVSAHLKGRKPYDVRYRLQTKQGEYRWFWARGQAIWNDANQPLRMAGSITDVTEEHSLRERFRLAVEASPAALLMVNEEGRIQMANQRLLAMFGFARDELIGQLVECLLPERFRAAHPAHRQAFFRDSKQRTMGDQLDLVGCRQDGSEFPVKIGLGPVMTAEGPAVICGVMDVTDQVSALQAMRQAKEAAELASRAKSSFLANMSHEIRTPMNGIMGMSHLLSFTELRPQQREYLRSIDESAQLLLRLLNDILDFSKIEAGKLELECVDFRLAECVARATQIVALRAAEKELEVACRIAPGVPESLRGDPGRLQQVLVNLLSNAVKFTQVGEIFVDIEAERLAADRVRIHARVCDTGIGIPADKLPQIFHAFEQAETSTTRRFGGSGLGLTISRQLIEMMGGRLWGESELNRGSTFHFQVELPVAATQQAREPAQLAALAGLSVLVVDDNRMNRRVLDEILRHWRMQPLLAESATVARARLRDAEAIGQPVRLILLDHQMPGEDGLEFAESLKGKLSDQSCCIILLSSSASPLEPELCHKLGIHRVMAKPVIVSELLDEVLRQCGAKARVASAPAPAACVVVQPRRVLLVEDNEINRRVAIGLLRSRGHQVLVAKDGQVAVDLMALQTFDIVLMDMQMPVMDGYEATARIRQHEYQNGGHIPIVAMTAEALKGDRERILACGVDGYLAKPLVADLLFQTVEQCPAKCVRADTAAPAPQAPHAPPPPRVASQPLNETDSAALWAAAPPVNWQLAVERVGGGGEMLRELSELAVTEAQSLLDDLRRGIQARDFKLLRLAAHSIKGSFDHFGAEPLVQAALALEILGREESLEGVHERLETLERELGRVLTALSAGPPAV